MAYQLNALYGYYSKADSTRELIDRIHAGSMDEASQSFSLRKNMTLTAFLSLYVVVYITDA